MIGEIILNKLDKNKNFSEEIQNTNDKKGKKLKRKSDKVKKKNKRRGLFDFFNNLADSISKWLKNGFLGFIFADMYTVLNSKWKHGKIYRLFHRTKNKVHSHASISKLYDNSIVSRIISKSGEALMHAQVRTIGIAMFAFAFAVIFMAMFKYYLVQAHIQDNVVTGIVIALFSLSFTVSKKRVGEALLDGKLSGYIIHHILTIDEGKLRCDNANHVSGSMAAAEIAMLFGFVTYFVHPLTMLAIFGIFIVCGLIMCFPELGIIGVFSIIPFVNVLKHPSIVILALILVTSVAYLFKFIRGKRIMRFELVDLVIFLFSILIFVKGIFTNGDKQQSFFSAAMYCGFLCMYFLIVNSYIRKTWIYRGIKLLVGTAVLVSVIGLIKGGVVDASLVDLSKFADMGPRINAFLGNPNMLGAYLTIIFPFALAQIKVNKRGIAKIFYILCSLAIGACVIFTWSRGAWLGLAISFIVFLLLSNFRSIWIVIIGATGIPALLYFVPGSISERFMSIFEMTDSSIIYRFNSWQGVLAMIKDNFLWGIGVGESAFKAVYEKYALMGTETLMHSHSLFLQILLELGIFGIIIFAVAIFMFMQKGFAGIKDRNRDSKSRTTIAAGIASICGALVMGITDHIWYNYRVFLIFWIVMALVVSLGKINEKQKIKQMEAARVDNNSRSAELDIFC